ncbi:flavin-containing monooxygenase FMO GS-OX5-like protein [Tanacetum coccineum]|uniref:Flavin-containing monooxygenase FMO GS-OX5-like protein n=1 Tax=Tanacetum coccineum TaxID=301880 RepID=A0ABQ4ZBX6_9ASTR
MSPSSSSIPQPHHEPHTPHRSPRHCHNYSQDPQGEDGTSGGVVAGALLATEIGVAAKALATEMGVEAKARYEIIFPWDKCIVTTIVAGPFRDQNIVVTGNGPSATYLSREIAMVAKEVHKSPRSQIAKVTKSVSHEMMETCSWKIRITFFASRDLDEVAEMGAGTYCGY